MRHSRFVAFTAMFLILAARGYADINDGMVSAWTFDGGNADDAFGNSHGILRDGAEATDGMNGDAMDFDGGAAYVEVPDVDAFDVMADGYTVSAWMNIRTGKDHSAIAWKGIKVGWGPNFTFRMCTVSPTDLTWGGCPAGVEGWFRTDGVYEQDEWTHIALTADGDTIIGYVNAEIVESGGQANPLAAAGPYLLFKDNPLEIGVGRAIGGNEGNDSFLDGSVDEVYLYDRALSEDELAELADGTRPNAVSAAMGVDAEGKIATAWGSLKAHR